MSPRIGQLDLLARLYARIVIPGPVWTELVEANPEAEGVAHIRYAEALRATGETPD